MNIGIVGSVNIDNIDLVRQTMDASTLPLLKVTTTDDPGVAVAVRTICQDRNIPCEVLQPDTYNLNVPNVDKRRDPRTGKYYNKRAGVDMNQKFVETCDAFIIIWDGVSPGIKDILMRIDRLAMEKHIQKATYAIKV